MRPQPCAVSTSRFRSSGVPYDAAGAIRQDAVVAPVAPAGERGDRHQLDGRDSEIGKLLEPAAAAANVPSGVNVPTCIS